MKCLVVNKQNPSLTTYIPPKNVGSFLWGRVIVNYIVLLIEDKETEMIELDCGDIEKIQEQINKFRYSSVVKKRYKWG